jgi:hypothetical protein
MALSGAVGPGAGSAAVTPTGPLWSGRPNRTVPSCAWCRRREDRRLAMRSDAASFIGNIPEHYDDDLGP